VKYSQENCNSAVGINARRFGRRDARVLGDITLRTDSCKHFRSSAGQAEMTLTSHDERPSDQRVQTSGVATYYGGVPLSYGDLLQQSPGIVAQKVWSVTPRPSFARDSSSRRPRDVVSREVSDIAARIPCVAVTVMILGQSSGIY